jgi:lipoate---protein ligase
MIFHLLHLQNVPIFEQLQIEEALLRTDTRNWAVVNEGSSPAIVMGISGKPHELVDREQLLKKNIPLIKRCSGGGTVIVDENTLFVTFICQRECVPFPLFPEPILKWSEAFYRTFLPIELKENDFVIGDKKCGGNAQYIKKDRFLHHTSFLWDYSEDAMQLLLYPKKTPNYRQGRAHSHFLCRLKDFLPHRSHFITSLKGALREKAAIIEVERDIFALQQMPPHRKETAHLTF